MRMMTMRVGENMVCWMDGGQATSVAWDGNHTGGSPLCLYAARTAEYISESLRSIIEKVDEQMLVARRTSAFTRDM